MSEHLQKLYGDVDFFFFFLCGLKFWEWFRSKVNRIIAASQIIIDLLQFINRVKI